MKKPLDKTKVEGWQDVAANLSLLSTSPRRYAIAEALAKAYREAINVGRVAGRIEEQARTAGLSVGEFARLYNSIKVEVSGDTRIQRSFRATRRGRLEDTHDPEW